MTFKVPDAKDFAWESRSGVKSNQIIPRGPSIGKLAELGSKSALEQEPELSFMQAFGILGILMLLTLLACFLWTLWLIFLALEPNKAANWLMNTAAYDKGHFWLINDSNPHLTMAGAIGLVVIDVCYLIVVLRMLIWRGMLYRSAFRKNEKNVSVGSVMLRFRSVRVRWSEITSFKGRNRKKCNAAFKLIDLAMEVAMLSQLLQSGSPVILTYGFACFLAVNSLSCVVNIITDRFSALTEIFIDSIFDLSAAVLFPIMTLVYCYYNFDFDREKYLISLEMLPPGSFEHLAQTFADPSEVAQFRVCFDSLRINSMADFVLRMSTNLTFCYRFDRLSVALVWTRQRERRFQRRKSASLMPIAQNPVPKTVTAVFIAISLAVLLSTNKAIRDSVTSCSSYPECAVYVHQWKSSDTKCPCLILIDIDLAPKTHEEWLHPVDATEKVTALAQSGMLTSLQIINRQLLEWPEELRSCHSLKSIHLMYTSTQNIPAWTNELQYLETIHIEGKYGSQNLVELPDNLFSSLPRLSTIHLGVHLNLEQLPPFTGVPHLQSLSLAWLNQLSELPKLDRVPELSRILMSIMPRLEQIPDLSPLRNLVEFAIIRPSYLCCNGFIGVCDLKHVSCQANPVMQTPATTCLKNYTNFNLDVTPFLGSVATEKAFKTFASSICPASVFDKVGFQVFPTKETIDMCEGKPFRECFLPGNVPGICYNTRFQVLSCIPDNDYIALRRAEIERGIGPTCDPVVEKWLGCAE